MKILQPVLIVFIVLVLFHPVFASAKDDSEAEGLSIGVYLGPTIPNENLKQIYDVIIVQDPSTAYEAASNLGYHIGGRARYGLLKGVSLSAGVQLTKFPGQTLTLTDSGGKGYSIETSTQIVPVFAGLTVIPFDFVVSPYISGELLYSYRSTVVNSGRSILQDLLAPGVELEPRQSRAGVALGFGIELNLAGLRPFVECKYVMSNLVGNDEGEQARTFVNISVGLMF